MHPSPLPLQPHLQMWYPSRILHKSSHSTCQMSLRCQVRHPSVSSASVPWAVRFPQREPAAGSRSAGNSAAVTPVCWSPHCISHPYHPADHTGWHPESRRFCRWHSTLCFYCHFSAYKRSHCSSSHTLHRHYLPSTDRWTGQTAPAASDPS